MGAAHATIPVPDVMGFPATIGALAPVFLLIALGWLLRRVAFLPEGFWEPAERLVYWVMFPALLLVTTAGAQLAGLRVLPVATALVAAMSLVAGATLLLRGRLGLSDAAFTSVLQSAIRPNTYIGLAAAQALWGQAGLSLSGLVIAFAVPTANLWSVLALARLAGARIRGPRMALAVLSNPLIVSCVAGFALNALGIGLAPLVDSTLRVLGQGSLPLALLCVGAGLELGRLGRVRAPVAVAAGLKLVATPAVTLLMCSALGVEGLTMRVAVLFNALPVSASSYVLARQMGGDAPLMAAAITVTTLGAAVTLPLAIVLLA
jgi:malonate transporter and related proteins